MASILNADDGVVSGSAGLKSTADSSGVLALQTNGTTAVTVTAAGSVGFGTTSPTSKLTVIGNIKAGYDPSIGIIFGLAPSGVPSNDVNAYVLWGDAASFGGNNGDLIYIPRTSTSADHRFYTGSVGLASEKVRISNNGNVGIGTSSPATKLDVVGTASFSGTVGVGGFAALAEVGLNVRFIGNLTGTEIQGVGSSISAPATASTSTTNFYSSLRTTATSGSRGLLYNFYAEGPTIGATSTANTVYGLYVANQGNAGITNAYGVRIEAQSGSTTTNYGLYNAGTSRLDGNVGLNTAPAASGTGITFPATQSASSDANTLDDYEEGTWNPVVAGSTTAGTVAYGYRNGYYTKIGRLVYLYLDLDVSSFSGGAGSLQISGLPFPSANLTNNYPVFQPWQVHSNWGTTYTTPTGYINPNTSVILMYTVDDGHYLFSPMVVNQTGRISGYLIMQTD